MLDQIENWARAICSDCVEMQKNGISKDKMRNVWASADDIRFWITQVALYGDEATDENVEEIMKANPVTDEIPKFLN